MTSSLKPKTTKPPVRSFWRTWLGWLDSDYFPEGTEVVRSRNKTVELSRCIPFAFLHVGCFAAFAVGCSSFAVVTAVFLYFIRMFAVTAFYHRYFSHRSFRTSRFMQFIFAALAVSSVQRGPLWWAAHHRHHHRQADKEDDTHSPIQRGFWWAHIGWITSSPNIPTDYSKVQDLAKYPELVFLNRFDWLIPALLALALYLLGDTLKTAAPQLMTSGPQLLVWGFFVSTVVLFHGTASINSLAHMFGTRRFPTDDGSKNNFILALVTLGEGWHNNHHRCQGTVHQGFYWWEVDISYYLLKVMSVFGLVYDLNPVPQSVYEEAAQIEELRRGMK